MTTSGLGLSIAVLAFGASTIYLAVQLSKERAYSGQLAEKTRALDTRIAELEKTRIESPVAMSGTFGGVNTLPGQTVTAVLPPPPSAARTEPRPEQIEAVLMNAPTVPPPGGEAFRNVIRAQMRAQNKQLYGDLAAQLGLSREDASKLIDLLTDQHVDGFGISRETTDPTERMRLMNEARRENQTRIADLLGPEKLKLLEQYQQTIPIRQEVDMLARQIEGSDAAPLSDEQRKRLLAAIIEERKLAPPPDYRRVPPGEDFRKTYIDWQIDYNARVAALARSILDGEQYAAYDQYQKWQKEMHAQMKNAAGPGGAVMFSTAPGTVVGDTAVVTLTATDEKPDKTP